MIAIRDVVACCRHWDHAVAKRYGPRDRNPASSMRRCQDTLQPVLSCHLHSKDAATSTGSSSSSDPVPASRTTSVGVSLLFHAYERRSWATSVR